MSKLDFNVLESIRNVELWFLIETIFALSKIGRFERVRSNAGGKRCNASQGLLKQKLEDVETGKRCLVQVNNKSEETRECGELGILTIQDYIGSLEAGDST